MTATTDKSEPVGQGRGEDMQTRLGRLLDEVEAMPAGQPDAAQEQTEAEQGTPAAGNPLGGLLSNPELLAALPQLMGALGPLMRNFGAARSGDAGAPARKSPPDRHTALLCALKPYLGSERRQAVEYLISVCRVWGTLQSVGLTLPALLSPEQGKGTPSGDKEV